MPPGYGPLIPHRHPYRASLVKKSSLHSLICECCPHSHLTGGHEEQAVTFSTTHSVGHREGHEDLLDESANMVLFSTTWFSS